MNIEEAYLDSLAQEYIEPPDDQLPEGTVEVGELTPDQPPAALAKPAPKKPAVKKPAAPTSQPAAVAPVSAPEPTGSVQEIPRNEFQQALGALGKAIQTGAEYIDFDLVGLPGIGTLTLKDLTVGDLGKVLVDISYGFYPVRGGNEATGGIGTYGLKPEAIELVNAAPAVGLAVKGTKKAAKAVTKGTSK